MQRPVGDTQFVEVADGAAQVIQARAALAVALELKPEQGMAISFDTLSVSVLEHVEGGLLRGAGGVWRVVGVNRLSA